ncbi:MAG: hypothetical protein PF692_00980 [Kiritimatiellae bacterium]|jgi:hypothetical protein|nr:hypothetical protein [Kiritimatiellia bacterium]
MNAEESESLLLYYYNELPEDKMLEINELVSKNEEYSKFINDLKYIEKMYIKTSETLKIPEVKIPSEARITKKVPITNFMWARNVAVAASILFMATLGLNILLDSDQSMSHVDVYNVMAFVDNLDKEISIKQAGENDVTLEEVSQGVIVYQGFEDERDLRDLWVSNF